MLSINDRVRSRTYAWHVTFGDLLTLLVCFFLVLTQGIATEPLKPPNKQGLTDGDKRTDKNGIAFANQEKTFGLEERRSLVVLEREVYSGQFKKRIAEVVPNCVDNSDRRKSSVLVRLCQSFMAEDKRSISIVRGVYEAVSSDRRCVGRIAVRFDTVCSSDELKSQDRIGSVEFVTSEMSDGRRV